MNKIASMLAFALLATACSSSRSPVSDSVVDPGLEADPGRVVDSGLLDAGVDEEHPVDGSGGRPVAVTCAPTRVPAEPKMDLEQCGGPDASALECTRNDDCTKAAGGRCAPNVNCNGCVLGARCTYDECTTDADCPHGGVCECGAGDGHQNVCVRGNCRTDAECGPHGVCALSLFQRSGFLPRSGYGSYNCRTPFDTCRTDIPCVDGNLCSFESGAWRCSGWRQCA